MAGTRKIDQAEWDRWAKTECVKVKRRPGIHSAIHLPKADQKVVRADRAVYDRCAAAMLARQLVSWSIDAKTGAWLVQVSEGEEWRELSRDQVAELLDEVAGPAPVVAAPVRAARAPKPVKVTAPKAAATPAPVREITSARSAGTTWTGPVADYLARLVFEPKRAYAAALAAHLVDGGPLPEDPGTEWAGKVRTKLARLVPAGRDLVAVAS